MESEKINPWFINKESSEIIVACFGLQCDQLQKANDEMIQEFKSLNDVATTVLKINTFLYGPTFQSHLVFLIN